MLQLFIYFFSVNINHDYIFINIHAKDKGGN